jgi:hypothetical protein
MSELPSAPSVTSRQAAPAPSPNRTDVARPSVVSRSAGDHPGRDVVADDGDARESGHESEEKKSLPLSSIRMNAGKSTTSIL